MTKMWWLIVLSICSNHITGPAFPKFVFCVVDVTHVFCLWDQDATSDFVHFSFWFCPAAQNLQAVCCFLITSASGFVFVDWDVRGAEEGEVGGQQSWPDQRPWLFSYEEVGHKTVQDHGKGKYRWLCSFQEGVQGCAETTSHLRARWAVQAMTGPWLTSGSWHVPITLCVQQPFQFWMVLQWVRIWRRQTVQWLSTIASVLHVVVAQWQVKLAIVQFFCWLATDSPWRTCVQ